MPLAGTSEGVDRLKMVVCCQDGCQHVAGFVAGGFSGLDMEKARKYGIYLYLFLLPTKKTTRFFKKFIK